MADERSIESEFGDAAVAVADASANGTADHGATAADPSSEAATGSTTDTQSNGPEASATESPTTGDAPDFLTQLTRAMQATAGAERSRAAEEIDRRSSDHIASIRARADAEAAKMRDLAGDDRRAIERWADSEQQRVKAERDRRTRELEADLTQSLTEHGRQTDVQIQAVEAVVAAHRSNVDGFFASLDGETDPVRFAQRAGQRPAFPDLDGLSTHATIADARVEPATALAPVAAATAAATAEQVPDAEPEAVPVMDPVAKLGLLKHSPEPSPFAKPSTAIATSVGSVDAAKGDSSGPVISAPVTERTSTRADDSVAEAVATSQPNHGGPLGWLRRNIDQE